MNELIEPCIRLRPLVEGYWVRRGTYGVGSRVRVSADACTKLIFELEPSPWPDAYLLGTQLAPIVVSLEGMVDRIGVRFRPGMAAPLLGVSMEGLAHQAASMAFVTLPEAATLHRTLRTTRSTSHRVHQIEQWLLAQIRARPDTPVELRETARIRRRLMGRQSLAEAATASQLSVRRFQLVCRERFGATAAGLRRCFRFQRLMAQLAEHPAPLACLAIDLGFSDQAHMAREFRHFAGVGIVEFLRERDGNLQDARKWLPVLRQTGGAKK